MEFVALHYDYEGRGVVPYSRGEWHCSTNRNEKPKVAWKGLVGAPSVCVRFTLQGLKFDSESSAFHED